MYYRSNTTEEQRFWCEYNYLNKSKNKLILRKKENASFLGTADFTFAQLQRLVEEHKDHQNVSFDLESNYDSSWTVVRWEEYETDEEFAERQNKIKEFDNKIKEKNRAWGLHKHQLNLQRQAKKLTKKSEAPKVQNKLVIKKTSDTSYEYFVIFNKKNCGSSVVVTPEICLEKAKELADLNKVDFDSIKIIKQFK